MSTPAWRTAAVPTRRYQLSGYTREQTDRFIRLLHESLPDKWGMGRGGVLVRDGSGFGAMHYPIIRAVACRVETELHWWIGASGIRLRDTGAIWRCFDHLRRVGLVEMVSRHPLRYIKHPLPLDPLVKPAAKACIRSAVEVVELAAPVDDSHVAVPQQMMRGLLSGALVR